MKSLNKQKGVVLIVSLMILTVLSMVTIASLSGTTMEERMSNNFQQDMVAFKSSESAISIIIDAGDPGGTGAGANPFYSAANDPLVKAMASGLDTVTTTSTLNMDPLDNSNGALTSATVVSYKGVNQLCPGYGAGVHCLKFKISAETSMSGTRVGPTHAQGIERPAPGV